jgi:hypothetical protein
MVMTKVGRNRDFGPLPGYRAQLQTGGMTSRTATKAPSGRSTARYWVLVHAGKIHRLNWNDGERLLTLSTAVLAGLSEPQGFTFLPRGSASLGEGVTIFLRPDEPIELITEYEPAGIATQSHWFG